jgi:hypothetical protein
MYGTFYKEVLARTLQETIGFSKRRVAFPSTMAVGIAVALSKFGVAHLTAAALQTNLIVIVSVYAAVLVLCFLWNFFVVAPVLLDSQLRTRLATIGSAQNERENKLEIRSKFAGLMEWGRHLHDKLGTVRGEDFRTWDDLLTDWQESVCMTLRQIDFPADCHEFMRATDDAEALGGSMDLRWKQENRRRKLKKQQQKLEDIVQRRLP